MKGNKSAAEMDTELLHESDASQDNQKLDKNAKRQPKRPKGNKKRQDSESDVYVETILNDDNEISNSTSGALKLPRNSKQAKNKKIAKKAQADEISADSMEDDVIETHKKFKKQQKNNAFAGLLLEDEDVEVVNAEDLYESEEEVKKSQQKPVKKDKKKNKRKDKEVEEEDLDEILAKLQREYESNDARIIGAEDLVEDEEQLQRTKKKKNIAEELNDEEESTLKTAAQRKREKKERQKRDAVLAKQRAAQEPQAQAQAVEVETQLVVEEMTNVADEEVVETAKTTAKNKKKIKKDKKQEEEDAKKDSKKKGMSAAMVAAMQERLKKIKEEEERLQREEEERIMLEEERENQRLEVIRLEAERKDRKKQKEAERRARLKAEGKLLTKKQKEERARAQAMLEALKAQGLEIPDPAERRAARPGTRIRPKKKTGGNKEENVEESAQNAAENAAAQTIDDLSEDQAPKIKESWDVSDSEREGNGEDEISQTISSNSDEAKASKDDAASQSGSEDEASETESESESESEREETHINANDPEAKRLRAEQRILTRQSDAEKLRTLNNLRAAVVCVLGHVDTGKTKILDKLRRTHVQDSEAGGITQQIGATNVPIDAIKEQSKVVREAMEFEYKLPGLLIIDTPGHESFSNLRNRGSSLCDIAILVVDIMHGLEPQTLESIQLLKKKKCPFIVALNKIDRLYDWKVMARRDVRDVLKEQQIYTEQEFNTRKTEIILQFAKLGLNAAMFYENPDPKTYISLVPTSAITGEGMGNLLFMIVEFCQRMLAKRLMYSEELQATVLEVKAIPGLGTTIDAILINGRLREGETMILAGTDGPIVTQIRSLLMPQPLKELRVKNAYVEYKEIQAAQGIKIAAKDLEKAIAGINLLIAHKPDEVEICKEEVARELKSALSHIKLAQAGVYVQASTLGSLEALLEFLRTSQIPYSAIRIGPVVKRDVMRASTMLEHEAQYATILAFDVKVEREAQEMADSLGVKIFQADIIYHLFDKFTAYREDLKLKKREEFKSIAVFPCKLKILPQFIFNSRDPIIMGIMVENGIAKVGTPICVPSKEFVDIGIISSIEFNHKPIDSARKGQEICVKIDPIPGESPKMFGRHFDADDMLVSKISRQSIDACKDYFRDDLIKADWSLMVELKKLFEIL